MTSPGGWEEPGQRPEFEESTVVLRGMLRVGAPAARSMSVAGQAVVTSGGVGPLQHPRTRGAEYVAVWSRRFPPETVHRDSR